MLADAGVFVGVCCRASSAWPGDLAIERADRIDFEILLVMGRWVGVGRVGVLKRPAFLSLGGGVEGHGGVPNRSAMSSSPGPLLEPAFGVAKMFVPTSTSVFSLPLPTLFEASCDILTTLIATSPRTLGCPSFLGDGNSSRRVLPIPPSPRAMGLSAVPLPRLPRDCVEPWLSR